MTDQELTAELTVTACAISVTAAIEALEESEHSAGLLKWAALGRGNDQAFELYERREQAFRRASSSLSKSLEK